MNRTQKSAVVMLVIPFTTIICLAVFLSLVLTSTVRTYMRFAMPILFLLVGAASFVWLFRKQNPNEVDEDERDKLLSYKACAAALATALVALGIATAAIQFKLGTDAKIPVLAVVGINVGVGLMSMAAYCLAILLQYSWRSSDAKD